MLTLKDCIGLSDLSDAEVAAIAEHEHVPEIVAAEIGCELINTPAGRLVVKRYIRYCAGSTARIRRAHDRSSVSQRRFPDADGPRRLRAVCCTHVAPRLVPLTPRTSRPQSP